MQLLTLKQMYLEKSVEHVKRSLLGISKPSSSVSSIMDDIEKFSEFSLTTIAEYMSKIVAWQTYYSEKLVIEESVKLIAETQKEEFYSMAIEEASGKNITEKKEVAKSDRHYIKAKSVYSIISMKLNATRQILENLDRAYKLLSRIQTNRQSEVV